MPSVSSAYLRNFVDACISLGAPEARIMALIPGDRSSLDHPDRRFPGETVIHLLDLTAEEIGNDTVGLLAGERFKPARFLEVGYALASASTLREALEINIRFQALTQELLRTSLEITQERGRIQLIPALACNETMRRVTETIFAGYVKAGRMLTRDSTNMIERIQFRHRYPGPHCEAAYRQVFGPNISFGARENLMILKPGLLSTPLPGANPEVVRLMSRKLESRLKMLRQAAPLRNQVLNCLHNQLLRGDACLEQTAALVGVSGRTLRRHLAAQGTSFGELLQEARREAAEVYVRSQDMTLTEIAHALGYGDQSAFVRAFRNWYGMPPGAYRRLARMRAAQSS